MPLFAVFVTDCHLFHSSFLTTLVCVFSSVLFEYFVNSSKLRYGIRQEGRSKDVNLSRFLLWNCCRILCRQIDFKLLVEPVKRGEIVLGISVIHLLILNNAISYTSQIKILKLWALFFKISCVWIWVTNKTIRYIMLNRGWAFTNIH